MMDIPLSKRARKQRQKRDQIISSCLLPRCRSKVRNPCSKRACHKPGIDVDDRKDRTGLEHREERCLAHAAYLSIVYPMPLVTIIRSSSARHACAISASKTSKKEKKGRKSSFHIYTD
jgi:hypothetical protein